MADDATRKLLKVFGVSVTDCGDALAALAAALEEPGRPGADPAAALEAYGRAMRELGARWLEVGRLLLDYQARAQQAMEAHLRARGGR